MLKIGCDSYILKSRAHPVFLFLFHADRETQWIRDMHVPFTASGVEVSPRPSNLLPQALFHP